MKKKIKLNLGAGKYPLKGFKNVDFRVTNNKIDIKCDVRQPLPFKDNSVDKIFASHIIEHMWWFNVKPILKDWLRVLKPKKHIDIWTVDFDSLIKLHEKYQETGDESIMDIINWRLHNKPEYDGCEHRCSFTHQYLIQIMKSVGFKKVKKLNVSTFPFNPMHKGINMGVRGFK